MTWRDPKDAPPPNEVVLLQIGGQAVPAVWSETTGWITLTETGGRVYGLDRVEQPTAWRPVAPEEIATEIEQHSTAAEATRQNIARLTEEHGAIALELQQAQAAEAEEARIAAAEERELQRAEYEALRAEERRQAEAEAAAQRRIATASGLVAALKGHENERK